jgi:carbon storage regulator CsrA
MLVLTRKVNERVAVDLPDGRRVWVQLLEIDRNKVRLAFVADKDVRINREEVLAKLEAAPS